MTKPLALIALLVTIAVPAHAQLSETARSWNQPVEPFRIAGNVYYVGASGVSSYLIETADGLILLDSGMKETVPIIVESVGKLGFDIRDVKLLLATHPHFDHAGGLAELKRLTGAPLVASALDAAAYARGDRDNHAWGDENVFEGVNVDLKVANGSTVSHGGITMTANVTPGHTDGCTTWSMKTRDGDREYDVVVVGSASVPGYQLVGNAKVPDIVAQYEEGFRVLESLRCDVFLSAHGWDFDLAGKLAKLTTGGPNPFVDPQGYRNHVAQQKAKFRKIVEEQTAKLAP